jgi:hypothetical protein
LGGRTRGVAWLGLLRSGGEGGPCYRRPHWGRTLRFLVQGGRGMIVIPDFGFWCALAPRVGAVGHVCFAEGGGGVCVKIFHLPFEVGEVLHARIFCFSFV